MKPKENLAFKKKIVQSSTYNQYNPTKAVDNDNTTISKTSSGDRKRTKANTLPWLQIDLKSDKINEYVVTGVSLQSEEGNKLYM